MQLKSGAVFHSLGQLLRQHAANDVTRIVFLRLGKESFLFSSDGCQFSGPMQQRCKFPITVILLTTEIYHAHNQILLAESYLKRGAQSDFSAGE